MVLLGGDFDVLSKGWQREKGSVHFLKFDCFWFLSPVLMFLYNVAKYFSHFVILFLHLNWLEIPATFTIQHRRGASAKF